MQNTAEEKENGMQTNLRAQSFVPLSLSLSQTTNTIGKFETKVSTVFENYFQDKRGERERVGSQLAAPKKTHPGEPLFLKDFHSLLVPSPTEKNRKKKRKGRF